MDQFLYNLYTLMFIGLSIWSVQLWWRTRSIGTLMTAALMIALLYENIVLALGTAIGHGPVLEVLSYGRFIGYAVFPPLLIISAVEMARRVGVRWAMRPAARVVGWVAALALITLALGVEVIGRELGPVVLNDVVRYMWVVKGVPPIAVILMTFVMIGISVAIWRKVGYPWLLIGSIFLLVGAGATAGKYVLGAGVELIFMMFVAYSELWVFKWQHAAHADTRPFEAPEADYASAIGD